MRIRSLAILAAFLVILGTDAGHAIPPAINYQGILTDGVGTPIVVPTNVDFRIWDAAAAGTELWMESQVVTPDSDGLFNVLLGTINPIPDTALSAAEAHLGITIAPDPEMVPRTQFVSVAYAYRPGTVDGATGGHITSKVTIGPGHTNTGTEAFVAGDGNVATGNHAVIGGGLTHTASGSISTIAGGRSNNVSSTVGTIGGGIGNTASGSFASTVGGGESNAAAANRATVGGGSNNITEGELSVISGGGSNRVDSIGSVIGGGRFNRANGRYNVIGGGGGPLPDDSNYTAQWYSTIGGGSKNAAIGFTSTVAGGWLNDATATSSTVGGGVNNDATGAFATIPGGWHNEAAGSLSFAAGGSAKAHHDGAVVITADHIPNTLTPVFSDTTGQMVLMARRSVCFTNTAGTAPHVAGRFINTHTDAHLTTGGVWTNSSDENKKENFAPVDRSELLEKIATLDIRRWNYIGENPGVQHIGPTAQEFHSLFQVGHDDKTISTIDPSGVALAAIQELHERTKEIGQLSSENAELRSELKELRALIEALAKRTK